MPGTVASLGSSLVRLTGSFWMDQARIVTLVVIPVSPQNRRGGQDRDRSAEMILGRPVAGIQLGHLVPSSARLLKDIRRSRNVCRFRYLDALHDRHHIREGNRVAELVTGGPIAGGQLGDLAPVPVGVLKDVHRAGPGAIFAISPSTTIAVVPERETDVSPNRKLAAPSLAVSLATWTTSQRIARRYRPSPNRHPGRHHSQPPRSPSCQRSRPHRRNDRSGQRRWRLAWPLRSTSHPIFRKNVRRARQKGAILVHFPRPPRSPWCPRPKPSCRTSPMPPRRWGLAWPLGSRFRPTAQRYTPPRRHCRCSPPPIAVVPETATEQPNSSPAVPSLAVSLATCRHVPAGFTRKWMPSPNYHPCRHHDEGPGATWCR